GRDQHPQGGEQAPCPTHPEVLERHLAVLASLREQQRRDEITADDEEHLDAEEAARHPPLRRAEDEVVVERHDREHRNRAQAIEPGQIAQWRVRSVLALEGGEAQVKLYVSSRRGVAVKARND